MPMFDRVRALELIERAQDDHPYCEACGRATTVHDEDGTLWLECPAVHASGGLLARLDAFLLPHRRSVIVDLREGVAA